jgi:hypothetical protein
LEAFVLVSCSQDNAVTTTPTPRKKLITGGRRHRRFKDVGHVFGEDGLTWRFDGLEAKKNTSAPQPVLGAVNLFQAALDVVSAYPIASSDSAAGVIVTDWKTSGSNARSKVIIRIADKNVQAQVFEQTYRDGAWWDTPPSTARAETLRREILKKAAGKKAGAV